jgi:MoaA/NifB/PqqE/SkfB family radical SAM enzyme
MAGARICSSRINNKGSRLNIPHDKFCVLPWVSLETSPVGTVRPCCLAEEEIVDDHGVKFDLNTASFAGIQNSQYMQDLRQQFLDRNQPQTCRKCWREESAGRVSKRMHTLDRLKHMLSDTPDWTPEAKPLMFLDLKLGNICNLKCRICGSWSSSTFAAEELQFIEREQIKSSHHYTMLRAGAWPRENPVFWTEIEKIVDQIQYIEFTGGEPFMIQEHFDMLQQLVDRGLAGQIEIHYNTNGTQYPENAENIWRYFKTVEIAFSIDDVGQRFEYQRSNAIWSEVCANIERFKVMRSQHHNIRLQVCTTVNVFNVYYLEQVAQWIDQQHFDFVYWNMMHEAYYFSISTLPDLAKQQIEKKLLQAQVNLVTAEEFSRIRDFMINGVGLDGQMLRMQIANLDRRRQQNLAEVEPELAKLIDYHGPN